MTVKIIIVSPDLQIRRQLGYFISQMREADEQKWRRPRSLWRRLREALAPDQPWWQYGGGNEWNNMPGIAFAYRDDDN